MLNEKYYNVWGVSVQQYLRERSYPYTQTDCLDMANAVSVYLNEMMTVCSDYNSIVRDTENGVEVAMPEHTHRYTTTIPKICSCANDFAAGYLAAQKATMERVQPHLKVAYSKMYPDS